MDAEKLHEIDENLTSSEVDQLKFLCLDLIGRKRLEKVEDAKDLFLRLDEQALLENGLLVPELLITIGRLDLLKNILKSSVEEVERNRLECDSSYKGVSSYRKMLLGLYEDMTEENLHSVKFLVELPKAKVTSSSFLDVMIEMEKQQKLGEDNLDELQNVLEKCDKQLALKIEEFKNKQGGKPPLQEVYSGQGQSTSFECKAEHPEQSQTDECYTVSQRPLGHCLIINNYKFNESTSFLNRAGTEKDKDDLEKLFKRMHFEVEVKDDLSASDIKDVIKTFAQKNHSQMGAFACCVLSHGQKGTVLGVDGERVEIRALTRPFAESSTLSSKPKLFFIQACQGSVAQNGVWTEDGRGGDAEEGEYKGDVEEGEYEGDAYIPRFLPIEADFLVGMATVEHYQSFRHTKEGSIYIQELCKQLESGCSQKKDILSILTKVNCEVSNRILKGHKQMPEPRYTLTKKLILPLD